MSVNDQGQLERSKILSLRTTHLTYNVLGDYWGITTLQVLEIIHRLISTPD